MVGWGGWVDGLGIWYVHIVTQTGQQLLFLARGFEATVAERVFELFDGEAVQLEAPHGGVERAYSSRIMSRCCSCSCSCGWVGGWVGGWMHSFTDLNQDSQDSRGRREGEDLPCCPRNEGGGGGKRKAAVPPRTSSRRSQEEGLRGGMLGGGGGGRGQRRTTTPLLSLFKCSFFLVWCSWCPSPLPVSSIGRERRMSVHAKRGVYVGGSFGAAPPRK